MTSPRKIHSSGFVVLDLLVADGSLTPQVGGTAANVAINLVLLGWQAAVSALLGDDIAGHTVREQLAAYGVDTAGVRNHPDVTTPVVIHEVADSRHRFKFSCPACGTKFAKFRPLPPESSRLAPEASIYFFDRASAYALKLASERRSESAIVFEPGTPGRPAATNAMAATPHLLRASSNLQLDSVQTAISANIQVIGLGSDGVRYRTPTETQWQHRPTQATGTIVDPGGAGDWLTAGVLERLGPDCMRSGSVLATDLDEAVDRGLSLAAACCAYLGTRGAVGTSTWNRLATELHAPMPTPEPRPIEIAADADCADWFHEPSAKG